jgi:predicted Zn-dependent peptidase
MTQQKLDNQRDVVKNERRWRVDNQPYGDWDERLQAMLYPPDHPYHHSVIGSMQDLDAASLQDVEQFFRTYYAPNNAVLSLVGDFEARRALELVERYFGPIPAGPPIPPIPAAGTRAAHRAGCRRVCVPHCRRCSDARAVGDRAAEWQHRCRGARAAGRGGVARQRG